jgi:uncharacterized membrane protein HdeD (DUF308 family)
MLAAMQSPLPQEVAVLSDTVKHAYRRFWWSLVIRGLLALALGILIIARPLDSIAALALVIAIWALFAGITELVQSFEIKPYFKQWWVLLLSGLIGIAFGAAALYYYPNLSLAFAVTWVSLWLGLTGVMGLWLGFQQKRLEMPSGWTFVWSVVSIIAAVGALVYPQVTLGAIMGLIAAFAIVSGITLLIGAFRIKSLESSVTQAVRSATTPTTPSQTSPA